MAEDPPKLKDVFKNVDDRRAISNAIAKAKKCAKALHDMEDAAKGYHARIHDLNKQFTCLFAGYVGICKNLTGGTKNHMANNVANLPRRHTLMDSIQNNNRIEPIDESYVNHTCNVWWTFLMTKNGGTPQHQFSISAPQYIVRDDSNPSKILMEYTRRKMVLEILYSCLKEKKRRFQNEKSGDAMDHELSDFLDAIVTVESDKTTLNFNKPVDEIIFKHNTIGCTVAIRKTNPVYDEIGHSRYNPQNFPGLHHLKRDQKVAKKVLRVCSDAGYFLTVAFSDQNRKGFAVEVHTHQMNKPYAVEDFQHVIVDENNKESEYPKEMTVVEIHSNQDHHRHHHHNKGRYDKDTEDNTLKSISLENNVLARVAELQYKILQKTYGNGRASKATPVFCQAQIVRNRDINDYAWSTVNVTWSIPDKKKTASHDDGKVEQKLKIHVKTVYSLTISNIANIVDLHHSHDEESHEVEARKTAKRNGNNKPAPKPLTVMHGTWMTNLPGRPGKKHAGQDLTGKENKHVMDHLTTNASIEALENFEKQKFGEGNNKLEFKSLDLGNIMGAAERVFSSS